MRLFLFALFTAIFLLSALSSAVSMPYIVEDIAVTIQADNAVKARDQAITEAQRQAFAKMTGKTVDTLTQVSDTDIARAVANFSIKNERLAARSYAAIFTVRFDPNRVQGVIQKHGLDLVDPGTGREGDNPNSLLIPGVEHPKTARNILVLPVLDIGSRRIIWDDPNPWREVWQQQDQSQRGLKVSVPLGDVEDMAILADARALDHPTLDVSALLARYGADRLYVVTAKSQRAALDPAGGLALGVYKSDGTGLQLMRRSVIKPRQGYMFQDAVPAAMQMIIMAQNNPVPVAEEDTHLEATALPAATQPQPSPQPVETEQGYGANTHMSSTFGTLIATVPYQSLPEWITLQRRLRGVVGIKTITPLRVSPSSAKVKIVSTTSIGALTQNMASAGFQLQQLANGEWAVTLTR